MKYERADMIIEWLDQDLVLTLESIDGSEGGSVDFPDPDPEIEWE